MTTIDYDTALDLGLGLIEFPDTFPQEWAEEGEHGLLILREKTSTTRRLLWKKTVTEDIVKEVVIPFRIIPGWPRKSGDTAHANIEHYFSSTIRVDEVLLDGEGQWKLKPIEDQYVLRDINFTNGDRLTVNLNLTFDGERMRSYRTT